MELIILVFLFFVIYKAFQSDNSNFDGGGYSSNNNSIWGFFDSDNDGDSDGGDGGDGGD